MNKKVNIIIVDDHEIYREGLKDLFNKIQNVDIVAEASNGKEFLSLIENTTADIIFIDIQMPVMNGAEACKIALQRNPDLKLIALMSSSDFGFVNLMLNAGVENFIPKNTNQQEIEEAIASVVGGATYFSKNIKI